MYPVTTSRLTTDRKTQSRLCGPTAARPTEQTRSRCAATALAEWAVLQVVRVASRGASTLANRCSGMARAVLRWCSDRTFGRRSSTSAAVPVRPCSVGLKTDLLGARIARIREHSTALDQTGGLRCNTMRI